MPRSDFQSIFTQVQIEEADVTLQRLSEITGITDEDLTGILGYDEDANTVTYCAHEDTETPEGMGIEPVK